MPPQNDFRKLSVNSINTMGNSVYVGTSEDSPARSEWESLVNKINSKIEYLYGATSAIRLEIPAEGNNMISSSPIINELKNIDQKLDQLLNSIAI